MPNKPRVNTGVTALTSPNATKGQTSGAVARAQFLSAQLAKPTHPIQMTKSMQAHPHRKTCEWLLNHGLKMGNTNKGVLTAFEFALMNQGRVQRGVVLNSEEHAAAMAGAAIWRSANPTTGKGGPGRGQGRKATDGHTDFVRISVNIRSDQHLRFKDAGGSAWLRQELDKLEASKKKWLDSTAQAERLTRAMIER